MKIYCYIFVISMKIFIYRCKNIYCVVSVQRLRGQSIIEKSYRRPAIVDIIGYTSMPDRPSETIMQVMIEDTMVEIPIDASQTVAILEKNPPGSKISVCFDNGEWHIEGNTTSSRKRQCEDRHTDQRAIKRSRCFDLRASAGSENKPCLRPGYHA